MEITRNETEFTITCPATSSRNPQHVRLVTPYGLFKVTRSADGSQSWWSIYYDFNNSTSPFFHIPSVTQQQPVYKVLLSPVPPRRNHFATITPQPITDAMEIKVVFSGLTFNKDQHLVGNFDYFWTENKIIDITFKCPNGKTLQAHRLLLASFTPYFEALLNFQAHSNIVTIKDNEFELYDQVLDFCYHGVIYQSLTFEGYLELYKHAHFLDIKVMLMPVAWFVVDRFNGTEEEATDAVLEWEGYDELQWHMCRKFDWLLEYDTSDDHPFVGHPGILRQLWMYAGERLNEYE